MIVTWRKKWREGKGFSYPTPATNEGMERVLANPVNPPAIQRLPMAYAG